LEKNRPYFGKVAQTVSELKNAEISTSKLNFKVQKSTSNQKNFSKSCFDTDNLGE
jgi:hypothetical protein